MLTLLKFLGKNDDLITALKKAKERRVRDAPPDIKGKRGAEFTDLSFHPEKNLIAVCNIDGKFSLFCVAIMSRF